MSTEYVQITARVALFVLAFLLMIFSITLKQPRPTLLEPQQHDMNIHLMLLAIFFMLMSGQFQ